MPSAATACSPTVRPSPSESETTRTRSPGSPPHGSQGAGRRPRTGVVLEPALSSNALEDNVAALVKVAAPPRSLRHRPGYGRRPGNGSGVGASCPADLIVGRHPDNLLRSRWRNHRLQHPLHTVRFYRIADLRSFHGNFVILCFGCPVAPQLAIVSLLHPLGQVASRRCPSVRRRNAATCRRSAAAGRSPR